jgi:hypothetical protein
MVASVPVTLASDQPAQSVTVSGGSVGITGTIETAPSAPENDTQGWGKRFYTSNTGATNNVAVIPINDRLVYAFEIVFATKTPRTFVSDDGGQTWTLRDTTPAGASGLIYSALWVPGGMFLLFTNVTFAGSVGLHASATGFQFTQLTLPGYGAAADHTTGGNYQGNTVILTVDPASGDKATCRSTNGGASFGTCVTHPGFGTFRSHAVTSPTANTWLITDDGGGIRRSVDDGQSWTTVATLGGNGGTVGCPTATICLHGKDTGVISRSVDAGATWATQITLPGGPIIRKFLNYGGGLVLALTSASGATSSIFRSTDFGATWTYNSTTPATGGSPDYLSATLLEGRTYIGNSGTVGEVWYSPSAVAGQYTIIGQNGAPLFTSSNPGRVDPTGITTQPVSGSVTVSGTVTANQGTAASSPGAWPYVPVQGATVFNTSATGAANTAVTATIGAAASTRAHLFGASAFCSAGTSSIVVADGATTIFQTTATSVGTTLFSVGWTVGLTGTTNTAMTVTLGACGAGNTGTLNVQADRF